MNTDPVISKEEDWSRKVEKQLKLQGGTFLNVKHRQFAKNMAKYMC
jgi:hypothetical protein